MNVLRLIDVDLQIPDDVCVLPAQVRDCRVSYALDGVSVATVRKDLEELATAQGYSVRRGDRDSQLRRGEQAIDMFVSGPRRIHITVDDATMLPMASATPEGISLAGVKLRLRGEIAIVPGRERHDAGSTVWRADWIISGLDGVDIARRIHDELLDHGLRSGGVWEPPKGGIQQWHVVGASAKRHVDVYILREDDKVRLSLVVVDENGVP